MKIVTLPNGFVLDLDCVQSIGHDIEVRSPFPWEYTGKVKFGLNCTGCTFIEMIVTIEQSKEIHDIILKHLNKRKDWL